MFQLAVMLDTMQRQIGNGCKLTVHTQGLLPLLMLVIHAQWDDKLKAQYTFSYAELIQIPDSVLIAQAVHNLNKQYQTYMRNL